MQLAFADPVDSHVIIDQGTDRAGHMRAVTNVILWSRRDKQIRMLEN
jgi:hypothetical protein